jgi:hypothetical protein
MHEPGAYAPPGPVYLWLLLLLLLPLVVTMGALAWLKGGCEDGTVVAAQGLGGGRERACTMSMSEGASVVHVYAEERSGRGGQSLLPTRNNCKRVVFSLTRQHGGLPLSDILAAISRERALWDDIYY